MLAADLCEEHVGRLVEDDEGGMRVSWSAPKERTIELAPANPPFPGCISGCGSPEPFPRRHAQQDHPSFPGDFRLDGIWSPVTVRSDTKEGCRLCEERQRRSNPNGGLRRQSDASIARDCFASLAKTMLRSAPHAPSHQIESNILLAFDEHLAAERIEVVEAGGQRHEMVSGELASLGGETDIAIGQQDFRLADAAGIEDQLPGARVAGVVLVADAEIEIAQRHPDAFAAPADVDDLADERQVLAERRAGLGRKLLLEPCLKGEGSGGDLELRHGFAVSCVCACGGFKPAVR